MTEYHLFDKDIISEIMPGNIEKSGFILQDHFYGKGGVKLLNLVKNGERLLLSAV